MFFGGDLMETSSGLTDVFLRKGYRREYKQGMPVILQGQASKELFLLAEGSVIRSILDEKGGRKVISINLGKCILGTENLSDSTASLSCHCHSDCVVYA